MAVKCRKCNKCIGKNDEYLSCRRESCNGSYHVACVGVTKSMLATMKKSGEVKTWSCGFCTPVSEHDGDDGDKRATILPPLLIDVNLNNLPDRLKDVLSDFSKQISRILHYFVIRFPTYNMKINFCELKSVTSSKKFLRMFLLMSRLGISLLLLLMLRR
jgi:hypothetical protein